MRDSSPPGRDAGERARLFAGDWSRGRTRPVPAVGTEGAVPRSRSAPRTCALEGQARRARRPAPARGRGRPGGARPRGVPPTRRRPGGRLDRRLELRERLGTRRVGCCADISSRRAIRSSIVPPYFRLRRVSVATRSSSLSSTSGSRRSPAVACRARCPLLRARRARSPPTRASARGWRRAARLAQRIARARPRISAAALLAE